MGTVCPFVPEELGALNDELLQVGRLPTQIEDLGEKVLQRRDPFIVLSTEQCRAHTGGTTSITWMAASALAG